MKARLTIDLDALTANWRLLDGHHPPAHAAAMVKADGYGLGAVACAQALSAAGCASFFVAHLDEGIALRAALPDREIFVLHGMERAEEARELRHHRLIPVLNSLAAVAQWSQTGQPAAVHLDTGLNRLGLSPQEAERLIAAPPRFAVRLWMSHLACADEPAHPLNTQQLTRFRAALQRLPKAPASLANSSGIFLGRDYAFDLLRPGCALYGINPTPGRPNPMREVAHLQAPIVQVHTVGAGNSVGYGGTHVIERPTRIATIAVGYADGYHRSLSGRGWVLLAGHRVPIVGRVSMDLITLDVGAVPDDLAQPGALVSLIGGGVDCDELATAGGTIAYESFTRLGTRFERIYLNEPSPPR